jgi:hypothetical protein
VAKQALFEVSCEERCEKLEAAFRMVWVYSHEISNHVTVILGNTQLIDDASHASAQVHKQVEEITRCARRVGMAANKISSLKDHFTHQG